MDADALSRRAYRVLLRAYPRGLRERFAADLEGDFVDLARSRGHAAAWRRAIADLRAVRRATATSDADRSRSPHGDPFMRSLLFDLRYAVRSLGKAPGFTLVTVLTLALGIGANTAIFTLVNAVLLRPLGFHEPERVMMIFESIPESGVPRFDVSPPDYLDLVAMQQSFSAIGAYRTRSMELSGAGDPEQIDAAEMTASVLDVLGVAPERGRAFLASEDQQPSNVAIISHALAVRRFGGRDPIGSAIVLDRTPYTVVGVMPGTFEFPKPGAPSNAVPADVWLPLVFSPFDKEARAMMYNHTVIARLRDGISSEQAAADTAALAPRIFDNYPARLRNAFSLRILTTMLTEEISGQVRRPLLILLAAVGLVLLVTCANVANLVLSRSVNRRREIGVRAALGAGRLRLFQVLMAEALILGVAGGILGLALGYWALRAVPSILSTSLPGVSGIAIDWRVVAFTGGLALGSAALFALVPMAAGMRRDLHAVLREASTRATDGRRQHRVQGGLVVASVAFAFILLVCAGLVVRSFQNLAAVDSGVGTGDVLSLQVRLPAAGYRDAAQVRAFYRTLDEQLRAVPGVRAVSIASDLPLDSDGERRAFTAENTPARDLQQAIAVTWVHGDYFSTYGVPLLTGRDFSSDEQRENRNVVVVSRRLAESFWPGEQAIGKRLKWGLPDSTSPWLTVIGITRDVVDGPPGSVPIYHAYVPYTDAGDDELAAALGSSLRRLVIGVRAGQDALAMTSTTRHVIAALDPALAPFDVQTIAQLEHDRAAPQRFSALVISGFGVGALVLVAIGLYGVLALSVAQRRREIGVRLALGAPRGEVLRLVVRQGMLLAMVGLALGALGSIGAVRLLRATLYETNVYDPATFAAVPLIVAAVAFAAAYLPARRAAAVDPIVALRID